MLSSKPVQSDNLIDKYVEDFKSSSKMRDKLKNLTKFIEDHINRTILNHWDFIKNRFHRSILKKTTLLRNDKGMTYPHDFHALRLSSLTEILCSSKLKLRHNELTTLYSSIKSVTVTPNDILLSRRIAAIRVLLIGANKLLLSHNDERIANRVTELKQLLLNYNSQENTSNILISIDEFVRAISPENNNDSGIESDKLLISNNQYEENKHIDMEMIEENRKADMEYELNEKRKKKMMLDFELSLSEIQPSLGPLSLSRHALLNELISFCSKAIRYMNIDNDITVSEDIINYLGIDCFPEYIQVAVSAKKQRIQEELERIRSTRKTKKSEIIKNSELRKTIVKTLSSKLNIKQHPETSINETLKAENEFSNEYIGFNGRFRLEFVGILSLLREMVSHGKGLHGCTFSEVVELLQAYGATRIQAFYRGYQYRYRYREVQRRYKKIIYEIKLKHYNAWMVLTRHNKYTKNYCWRKIVAWRYYVKTLKNKREYFRQGYWPFYVWRRYTNQIGRAKEKSKFLTTRVYPTYLSLKVFHAWKSYTSVEVELKRKVSKFINKVQNNSVLISFLWLLRWTRRRKLLRRAWYKSSKLKYRSEMYNRKNISFNILKVYAYYTKLLQDRIHTFALSGRRHLFTKLINDETVVQLPIQEVTLKQKRINLKLFRRRMRREAMKREEEIRLRNEKKQRLWNISTGENRDPKDTILYNELTGNSDNALANNNSTNYITITNKEFQWKLSRKERFCLYVDDDNDVDEDDFTNEVVPKKLVNMYENDSAIEPLLHPLEFSDLVDLKQPLLKQLEPMWKEFKYYEIWNIFESSMRFHRFGHKCFKNLYKNMIINRNKRKAYKQRNRKLLALTFNALVGWMFRDPLYVKQTPNYLTESEILSDINRKHRQAKMYRRRQAAIDIMKVFKQQPDLEIPFLTPNGINRDISNDSRYPTPNVLATYFPDPSPKSKPILTIGSPKISSPKPKLTIDTSMASIIPDSVKKLTTPDEVSKMASPQLPSNPTSPKQKSPKNIKTRRKSIRRSSVKSNASSVNSKASTPKNELTIDTSVSATLDPINENATTEKAEIAFIPPNFLLWDRQDRESDLELAERLMFLSSEYRVKAVNVCLEADMMTSAVVDMHQTRGKMLNEVLKEEENITVTAAKKELLYSKQFKTHAINLLIDTLCKIHTDIQKKLDKFELKKYFRYIRLYMYDKRSISMLHRKQITNWIRICNRLININDKMKYYYQMKLQWKVYNRWLKFIEYSIINCTSNLRRQLKRNVNLFSKFSNHMHELGYQRVVYYHNVKFNYDITSFKAIFYRWIMAIHEEKLFSQMEKKYFAIYKLRQLQKCFNAIRTESNVIRETDIDGAKELPNTIVYNGILQHTGFPVVRLLADLQQFSKRFIAKRRQNLYHIIVSFHKKFNHMQKIISKATLSFKKFIHDFTKEVAYRLVTEQRILAEAFEKRGIQEFIDVQTPSNINDPRLPVVMTHLEGKRFCDPKVTLTVNTSMRFLNDRDPPPAIGMSKASSSKGALLKSLSQRSNFSNFEDANDPENIESFLPSGFQLRKIRITVVENVGIFGWQLVWGADGARDIESVKRGRWLGVGIIIQEVIIPKDDFVLGLEYTFEGSTIQGIRLRMMFDGWTKWVGLKPMIGQAFVFLHADMSDKLDFDKDYIPAGRDEHETPALPRNFVIGLAGIEIGASKTRKCSCLSLVVRKIKDQHIFSYLWVQDGINKKKLLTSSEDTLLGGGNTKSTNINLPVEITSIPSHFDEPNQVTVPINESISFDNISNETIAKVSHKRITLSIENNKSTSKQFKRLTERLPLIDRLMEQAAKQRLKNKEYDEKYSQPSSTWNAFDDGEYFEGSDEGSDEDDKVIANSTNDKIWFDDIADSIREEPLTAAEEQFFDVVRMRTTEVNVAQIRIVKFARRVWTSSEIRHDPELSKLSHIKILSPLTKWFFEAISKRLVTKVSTEQKGIELLGQAHIMRVKSEILDQQIVKSKEYVLELENKPQAWSNKTLLSPKERLEKNNFYEKIKNYYLNIDKLIQQSVELKDNALINERRGRLLLPRMELSIFVCNNIWIKVSAARTKESLLEKIDLETMKQSLCGDNEVNKKGLSSVTINSITSSIRLRKKEKKQNISLMNVINNEISLEYQRQIDKSNKNKTKNFFKSKDDEDIMSPIAYEETPLYLIDNPILAKMKENEKKLLNKRKITFKKKQSKLVDVVDETKPGNNLNSSNSVSFIENKLETKLSIKTDKLNEKNLESETVKLPEIKPSEKSTNSTGNRLSVITEQASPLQSILRPSTTKNNSRPTSSRHKDKDTLSELPRLEDMIRPHTSLQSHFNPKHFIQSYESIDGKS